MTAPASLKCVVPFDGKSFLIDAAWFDAVRNAALYARNAPTGADAANQFLSSLMSECEHILLRAEGFGLPAALKQEGSQ